MDSDEDVPPSLLGRKRPPDADLFDFDEIDEPVQPVNPYRTRVPTEVCETTVWLYWYVNNTRPIHILKLYTRRDGTTLRSREYYKSKLKQFKKQFGKDASIVEYMGRQIAASHNVPADVARQFIEWLESHGCVRNVEPVGPLLPVPRPGDQWQYGDGIENYDPLEGKRTTGVGKTILTGPPVGEAAATNSPVKKHAPIEQERPASAASLASDLVERSESAGNIVETVVSSGFAPQSAGSSLQGLGRFANMATSTPTKDNEQPTRVEEPLQPPVMSSVMLETSEEKESSQPVPQEARAKESTKNAESNEAIRKVGDARENGDALENPDIHQSHDTESQATAESQGKPSPPTAVPRAAQNTASPTEISESEPESLPSTGPQIPSKRREPPSDQESESGTTKRPVRETSVLVGDTSSLINLTVLDDDVEADYSINHHSVTVADLTRDRDMLERDNLYVYKRQAYDICIGGIERFGQGGQSHPLVREALRQLQKAFPQLSLPLIDSGLRTPSKHQRDLRKPRTGHV